jgi:hypothetical protein
MAEGNPVSMVNTEVIWAGRSLPRGVERGRL